MGLLHISLFGGFHIQCNEQPLVGFDARKIQELFCYLLIYRGRPHSRELVAELLWSDVPAAQSKKYLRQALWQLQTALDNVQMEGAGNLLVVDSEWLSLNARVGVWLDAAIFEDAYVRVRGIPGPQLNATTVQEVHNAVQLYRGGLLENWYQDWCLYERERFQSMYLGMLDKLMSYCEEHRQYEVALGYGEAILYCERGHERTYRSLMRLHYLAGDRTAALRQYDRCVAALERELGVKPARSTVELYEQIRSDRFTDPSVAIALPTLRPNLAGSATPDVLNYLNQLRSIIGDLQQQIQQQSGMR